MSTESKIWIPGQLQYEGPHAAIKREEYATVAEMKAMPELSLNEGCFAVVLENKKMYRFFGDNSVDEATGKWGEIVDFTPEFKQQLATLHTASGSYATTQQVATAKQEAIAAAQTAGDLAYVKKTDSPFTVDQTATKYTFKYNGTVVVEVDKVKDSFLKNAVLRDKISGSGKEIVLTVGSQGSQDTDLVLDVTDAFKVYTAGTGIEVSQAGAISVSSNISALPAKVQALEGRPNYELGFTKNGRKLPVQQEANKLFVEVDEQAETPVVSASQNGLMTPELLATLQNLGAGYAVVHESEFNAVKNDGDNLNKTLIIHVVADSKDLDFGGDATEGAKRRKNLIAKDKRY